MVGAGEDTEEVVVATVENTRKHLSRGEPTIYRPLLTQIKVSKEKLKNWA